MGLSVLSLILSLSAHAAVNEVYEGSTEDAKILFVVHDEAGKCFLDTYQIEEKKLQERIDHQEFTECHLARKTVAEKGGKVRDEKGGDSDFVTETDDYIWEATDSWSADWENRYSQWVRQYVDDQFHYAHNIATDCADGAISTRWIFARMNHLPMGNTLAGSGALFTNESMKRAWKALPTHTNWWEDRRFLAALDYILDNSYTHSLIEDSYPIRIAPGVFGAGTHHLNLYSERTGHTMLVIDVNSALGVKLIYSSTPRAVRRFWINIFSESQYYGVERGGFLKIRWAEKVSGTWRLRAREEMPDYSFEQYQDSFMDGYSSFQDAVLGHMGITIEPVSYFIARLDEFESAITTRIQVVKDGYSYCLANDCSPETEGWELWGTPNRDARVRAIANDILALIDEYYYSIDEIYQLTNDRVSNRMWTIDDMEASSWQLMWNFSEESTSHDPRESVRNRWGL